MEIECEFSASLLGYSCEVSEVAITEPNVDIARFKGTHRPGKSNEDVTAVNFDNARVENFPRNLQKIFPKLHYLTIKNCGLKQVFREDPIGLEQLEWLDLSDNQLTSLPDDLFSNMPSLKYVSLCGNKIEFASSKLIEPIVGNQLKDFALTGNANINEYYMRGVKHGCETIQELMAKIDEKCKPPKPKPILKTAHHESISDAAEEFSKLFYFSPKEQSLHRALV